MTIDLKKDFPRLYRPGARDFDRVTVPPTRYLTVRGAGDPNTSPAYRRALELLYCAAYVVRGALKARTGEAFVVGPLEALWWAEDPSVFTAGEKDRWEWTLMIPLPDQVSQADLETARIDPEVSVARLDEGDCLQIMHVGPYAAEGPTLARLHHEVMPRLGVTFNGPHHEIYLSDPRRSSPEKLRTVLRQPVRPESPQ
ncbi:GyrI-like domain-containing protein [Corynebacterium guangdongense]|uniref:GyrI-like small molecule binding domain-containing protein n=1 Tax=Corynebacterium guangdongense TaxID=1783348 RepID=A0ABU1ZZV1_9CORY|nr:GyrI-like domain-containing protein [Corynebacterium guangdongense]MDR7329787.1 hypothetical protein [Corynebacterium guangdongense]WJZ18350.1 hypothetical protein CGUA_08945 [Corynebacterium guangdongense]